LESNIIYHLPVSITNLLSSFMIVAVRRNP